LKLLDNRFKQMNTPKM